ncbi:TIGR00725 family protein [Streptomyces sp. 8N706]|uniref:TIGR00725 family protein n=1 Tax=Streptomyces sp. 8N706 TaxID=3457416 RepID=UPI003FD1C1A6
MASSPRSSARRPFHVAVVGPENATDPQRRCARRVGELLGERGAVVVCGGLGGVMEAVCEGAHQRGGTTVGLLPGLDRHVGNPYLSVAVATGLGELRNGLIVNTSDAVISVGGSWGTLSEVALAMRAGKPTIVIDGWGVRTGPVGEIFVQVASAEDAVAEALSRILLS